MQIVAPAGSFEGLRASIIGGADAVYLGMPNFGARAKAQNFDNENLAKAIELAHLYGVKVFVTLNTLIKDGEMQKAVQSAAYAASVGADAAIVQDIRLIKELKHKLPDFSLHASTQMGVHNADGAKVLQDLGIKRAVLARETLPSDICAIKDTGIEIEYFVQGALCICFSGNCYFSSLASSYSGNRGKCMQLCRKPYFWHGEKGYFLSAKDLCLYDKLQMLEDCGVDAIKIEGRMRSAEYALQASRVYGSGMSEDCAVTALKSVFNRGEYCSGYLEENAPFNIIYPQSQSNIGLEIGKVINVSGNILSVKNYVPNPSDGFKIMRNKKEVCGATVQNGIIVSDKKGCKVGDSVRRTFDGALSQALNKESRNIDVDVEINIEQDEFPYAVLRSGATVVRAQSKTKAERATNCGLDKNDLERVFGKVADLPFSPKITANIGENVFMPISALNDLRRTAYSKLATAIVGNYRVERSNAPYIGLRYRRFDGRGVILMIDDETALERSVIDSVDYVVINPKDYSNFKVPKIDKPILLNAPITMRGQDREIISAAINRNDVYGIVSNNIYTLNMTDKPILLGTGHNIIGDTDLPHIRSFESDRIGNGFAYVFGYAPLMTLCHCPYGKCINCDGKDVLTDESGRKFILRRYRAKHCYWQLLNCVPHYLTGKGSESEYKNRFYDCTGMDSNAIKAAIDSEYCGDFTRGNIKKGLK